MENKNINKVYSSEELSQSLQISIDEIEKFESEGVFEFSDGTKSSVDQENFNRLKAAVSLYKDLGVNIAGIDIILSMKEKMAHLQMEFNDLLQSVQKKLGNEIQKDMDRIKKGLE